VRVTAGGYPFCVSPPIAAMRKKPRIYPATAWPAKYACKRRLRHRGKIRCCGNPSKKLAEMPEGRAVRAKLVGRQRFKRTDIRIRTRMWLMQRFAPKTFGDRLQLDAGAETIEALAARSPEERLADAKALIARAKRRVAEAYESGEVSDADYSEDE
jgi:hypothetical protein